VKAALTWLALRFATIFLFLTVWVGISAAAPDDADKKTGEAEKKPMPPFVRQLDKSTLLVDGRTVNPARTQTPFQPEYQAGAFLLAIDKDTVSGLEAKTRKKKWTVDIPEVQRVAFLAADDNTAYFLGYFPRKDGALEYVEAEDPPQVRRLELSTGKWLKPLVLGKSEKKDVQVLESVESVLADGKRVVIFATLVDNDPKSRTRGDLLFYRVACFKAGETKPLWDKTFEAAGARPRPGVALLWSSQRPNAASPVVRPLSWVEDEILVCAGDTQDILRLERDTGKTSERVERIWEFERGFIGPSVWEHTMERRGGETEEKKDKDEKPAPKKAAKPHGCAIIGGPIVLPDPEAGYPRIFVAVAKAESGTYANYLADCVVYELGSGPTPVAKVNVPRIVRGDQFRSTPDGVVWACQEGGLVKIAPMQRRNLGIGGPGGSDRVGRVAWYREPVVKEPDAWLQTKKAGDPIAFSPDWAFRVAAGGFVDDEKKPVFEFPLFVVDLKTGLERPLTLKVPYTGTIPLPKTNYSSGTTSDGKKWWSTLGPYQLGVTYLEVVGNDLRVIVAWDDGSASLDFPLAEITRASK
jgi:hypothetical protein